MDKPELVHSLSPAQVASQSLYIQFLIPKPMPRRFKLLLLIFILNVALLALQVEAFPVISVRCSLNQISHLRDRMP
jgi:hypothetical protein